MSPPDLRLRSTIGGTMSAEALLSHAHKLLANCGVAISPSKVSRMVREYKRRVEQNGFPFEAFLVNTVQLTAQQRRQMLANPDIARAISYSDPTGETAVNNVTRGNRRAPADSGYAVSTSAKNLPDEERTSKVDKTVTAVEDLVPDPSERQDILAMASVSDATFEEILAEARAEGDLSRANVAHKCKAKVQQ